MAFSASEFKSRGTAELSSTPRRRGSLAQRHLTVIAAGGLIRQGCAGMGEAAGGASERS